jgi:hypothetical protein
MVTKGHADYDITGQDIVCAAVSTLAQTLVNSLEAQGVDPTYSVDEDGYLDCIVPKVPEILDDIVTQTIFKTIKVGIEGISEAYGEYVRLFEEEVQ